MQKPIITCKNVTYATSSKNLILNDVSFSLPPNTITGLLGINGAGKSTLLSLCSGVCTPTDGNIEKTFPNNKLGYLPETPPLLPNLSVIGYLTYVAKLKKIKISTKELNSVLQKCDLENKKNKTIATLSKGNRQRVGIAQAILNTPKLLLLDEPMSGLDPEQIIQFRKLLTELKSTTTILFSTHILSEIENLCDQSIILHNKKTKIVSYNTPKEENYTVIVNSIVNSEQLTDNFVKHKNGTSSISQVKKENLNALIQQALDKGWQITDITQNRNTPESAFLDAVSSKQQCEKS